MGQCLSYTFGNSGFCATATSILKMLNSLSVTNKGPNTKSKDFQTRQKMS